MNNPKNSRLLYSYYRTEKSNGVVQSNLLSAYAHSIIFDSENRNLWHKGMPFGNSFWGSYHGETFNDFAHNIAYGDFSHAEGSYTSAMGTNSHAQGYKTTAYVLNSSAIGDNNIAYGIASNVEGYNNITYGAFSHTEGESNISTGIGSHSEGYKNNSIATYSHVEGSNNIAYGITSHIEGNNNITYGAYSHAEGIYNVSYGIGSHSEGYSTVAYGDYSHSEGQDSITYGQYSKASGKNTVTYNKYEVALGQYNKSITPEKDGSYLGTLLTIGNGTDINNLHNIVEIHNDGSLIKNGSSYFNDNIYGPVTYTYIAALGSDLNVNSILTTILDKVDEAKYTKPQIYGIFKSAYSGDYLTPTLSEITENIEIGTGFTPELIVHWPLSTECSYGTRQDAKYTPATAPGSYVFGYSYGATVQGANIIDYSGNSRSVNINTPVLSSNIDFNKEGTYNIFTVQSISYLKSSYSFYTDLFKNGYHKYSYGRDNTAWFDTGIFLSEAKYNVNVKYKYYWGLSDSAPTTKEDLQQGYSYFLNLTSENSGETITTMTVGKDGANKKCFWIAYPTNFSLIKLNDNYRIQLDQSDGISFDLISGWQKMSRNLINISLGSESLTTNYYVAYCNFDSQIGNEKAMLTFKILPNNIINIQQYLTDEIFNKFITDYTDQNITSDNNTLINTNELFGK